MADPFIYKISQLLSHSILYAALLALILPLFGSDPIPVQENRVTIGLLVPDHSFKGVIGAAELAIKKANERGGFKGIPFQLVVRYTEGPWGAGSKESVALVYEDDVRAIVGSLDGRNAHLAEQVAAKSHLVYLETRATDPTLSQAYVPWFIRNVPNDNHQAMAILDLIGEEGAGSTVILVSEDYDARYAAKSLTDQSSSLYGSSPLLIKVGSNESDIAAVIEQVKDAAPDHLVVPFFSEATLMIVKDLRKLRPDLKVYGTLAFSVGLDALGFDLRSQEGMKLIRSYWGPRENSAQKPKELAASYTYDGISLILQAITRVGLERESIRDYILQQDHPSGITGPIKFDDMGNRSGTLQLQ